MTPRLPCTRRERPDAAGSALSTSSLPSIQGSDAPGILGEEKFQVLFDGSAADKLMAGKKDRLDTAIQQALSHLATQHVQDHGAAQGAERAGPLTAAFKL